MKEIRQLSPSLRLALLNLSSFNSNQKLRLTRRENEKIAVRHLIHALFPDKDIQVCYSPSGQPYLNGLHGGISISHSHDLIGILHDAENTHTGLDIELIREKVLKIRHKFLSAIEQNFIPPDNVRMHIMAWCAKETMFKIHSEGNLDFASKIQIDDFTEDSDELICACTAQDFAFKKKLKVEQIGEYIYTWPTN